jgi:hypothetical protein
MHPLGSSRQRVYDTAEAINQFGHIVQHEDAAHLRMLWRNKHQDMSRLCLSNSNLIVVQTSA